MSLVAATFAPDPLSIWRSPLDQVALKAATVLAERQPRCIVTGEDLSAMTIYNYGNYLAVHSDPSTALSYMLSAMSTNAGGVAFIPQLLSTTGPNTGFTIGTIPTGGFGVPDQCNIVASGPGGSSDSGDAYYHFAIVPTGNMTFLSCSSGAYTTGGAYFQGIAFQWSASTSPGDTCIFANVQNCTALRCTFTDCPTAFYANAPGCTLKECTIFYKKMTAPGGATAVTIASAYCAVIGPGELEQTPVGQSGPSGCTCISIQGGADHTVISNTHISEWTIGIDFSKSGGSTNTQIRNCECQSYYTAINILNGYGVPISGVKVTSCTLARSNSSGGLDAMSNPIVLISPGTFDNSTVSDVTLLNCTVYNKGDATYETGQYGLNIVGGTNIKVLGGTYSNNSPNAGAGIAITGQCGDVQIIGTNLQPSYDDGTGHDTGGGSAVQCQAYGLVVTTNPALHMKILVRDCDMRGYNPSGSPACGIAPVYTTGITQGLFINDCLGYNDQNTVLNGGSAPTTSKNAATCSNPYYGPSIIAFSCPTPVTLIVFGQPVTLAFGVIFLPSPYDSFNFTFSMPPTGFVFSWYGK